MSLRARLRRYRLPLGGTVRTARAAWQERSGTLLTLEDERGGFGQGEAAPLPGYSDESLARAEQQLDELDLGMLEPALLGALSQPSAIVSALAALTAGWVPSARFALESAAFDWLSRQREQPVHALLRESFRLPCASAESLQLAALLASDEPLAFAEQAVRDGFRTLKLKVGLPGREREELELVGALRARFSKEAVNLRLDANRAWSSEQARRQLEGFAAFAVEFIEEPTALGQVPLSAPAVPVALDESLRESPPPSRAELGERNVKAWVLKPTVLGGFANTLTLAQQARALGCASVISHCFEGAIGDAATCELALALGPSTLAQGLGPHEGLSNWPARPSARASRATLAAHRRPGLGLGPVPLEPMRAP